jgi:predicted metal-dependent HD superfamily phosphohydrolase
MLDTHSEWGHRKTRFFNLWSACQKDKVAPEVLEKLWTQLSEYYSEPYRFYHTRDHILYCLDKFDRIKDKLKYPEAVEMAIWYHDIIYDVTARDNEIQSALYFQNLARPYLSEDYIDKVSQLILATIHNTDPKDTDTAYLQDIDLSSFGETWGNFLNDGDNLRKETPHLTDEQYYDGKIIFFQMLLNRERIYFSDYFYNCYEETARRNIQVMLHRIIDPDDD